MTKPNIRYNSNGQKNYEEYIENDVLHRDPLKGPAIIRYDESGKIIKKVYIINDKLHNPYGPAWVHYKNNVFEWWLNDIHYTDEVNRYLYEKNLDYKIMSQQDFDIMWMNVL